MPTQFSVSVDQIKHLCTTAKIHAKDKHSELRDLYILARSGGRVYVMASDAHHAPPRAAVPTRPPFFLPKGWKIMHHAPAYAPAPAPLVAVGLICALVPAGLICAALACAGLAACIARPNQDTQGKKGSFFMPYRADKIDWNGVDLTRDAKELAAELHCHTSQIYRARKLAGVVVPKKSGGPIYGPRPGAGAGSGGARPGGGRPKKAEGEKLANVALQLLPAVVAEIDSVAEKLGLTRAKVMREAIAEYLEKVRQA